jgi:hypothetical protein
MNTTIIFTKQSLVFDSTHINVEQVPVPIPRAQFGILNLAAISVPGSNTTLELVFSIDQSGSMSDACSDGRSKMQHIIHTLKNMVMYFRENPDIKVYITIDAFDDNIYSVVERSAVRPDNLSELIAKIELIMPRGSTDIEKALVHAGNRLQQLQTEFPSHTICHVFMTDGVANTGEQRTDELMRLVNRDITSAFIGFGLEHDGSLLSSLGSGKNSAYYFIDKIENAGLVYGEILHGVVYKFITNARLSVENGFIYDFKNNTWVRTIEIEDVVGESDKSYHIASNNMSGCVISFTGNRLGDPSRVHYTITRNDGCEDLSKFIYRQRTLQHLFAVNKYLKKKNAENPEAHDLFTFVSPSDKESAETDDYILLRTGLRGFIDEMKQFMTNQHLMNDNFMKNLCDDIYICYRTFGTKYGAMYATSRQASQGNQRCYTVNHTPDDINKKRDGAHCGFPPPPKLKRSVAATFPLDLEVDENWRAEEEDDELEHSVSGFVNSTYRTPSAAYVMRVLSNGAVPVYDVSEEASDEEEEKETKEEKKEDESQGPPIHYCVSAYM